MQRERSRAGYVGTALLCAIIAAPAAAHAYCRTTSDPGSASCPAACASTGVPLAWGTPELEYALNRNAFVGMDEAELRDAIAHSFAHWSTVSCNGVSTGFTFSELPARTDLTVGPVMQEPNLNVISELNAGDWAALGFDSHAFAKTQLWFETKTGEIVGADIAFNGSIGDFGVCPDAGCAPDVIDLENVATHEIGHLLGLAHSADPSATMWCDAVKGDLAKRTLSDDDEAGLCAIYGSHAVFADPAAMTKPGPADGSPSSSSSGGCALADGRTSPSASSALSILLTLLISTVRRRKL